MNSRLKSRFLMVSAPATTMETVAQSSVKMSEATKNHMLRACVRNAGLCSLILPNSCTTEPENTAQKLLKEERLNIGGP